MKNVQEIEIDPDIVLDENRIKGMSEELKGHLLTTMTIAAEKYKIHWTNLTWKVKMIDNQPVISVKPRQKND